MRCLQTRLNANQLICVAAAHVRKEALRLDGVWIDLDESDRPPCGTDPEPEQQGCQSHGELHGW
jgi:hypothetical protein